MARDNAKSSRDQSPYARSAQSARSAGASRSANARSAAGADDVSTHTPRSSTSRSNASNAAKSGSSTADTAATDRERSIETGRETTRRSTGVDRSDRVSPLYQYAAGLSSLPSPFTLIRRMAEDMDRLFQDFANAQPQYGAGTNVSRDPFRRSEFFRQAWTPQIETFRRENNVVVRADLPGLKKEDVKVEVEDNVLSISGERNDEREDNKDDYYRSERSYGRFYRAVQLPDGVKADDVQASFKDGVLEVTVPVPKESSRARKEVRVV